VQGQTQVGTVDSLPIPQPIIDFLVSVKRAWSRIILTNVVALVG
jgi:hypothetical protein